MARIKQFVSMGALVGLLLAGASVGSAADEAPLHQKALRLNEITGQDAISGKILELLQDKANTRKMLAEAAGLIKEKDKDQPFNFTGAYILARTAHGTKDYDNSLVFYKVCVDQAVKLKSGQKLVQSFDGLISLLMETKKFDDAVRACQQFLEIRGDERIEQVKPFVMEQMILALAKQKKHDDALKLTEKLVEVDEGGWYFVRLKAEILRDAGKFDEALKAFEDTLDRLDKVKAKDDEDKQKFEERISKYREGVRYVMTSVYTDLNQIDKAAEILQDLVKKHPERATYYNDLGYIWADHDKNLDECERLIRKALELEKADRKKLKDEGLLEAEDDHDNAAYLDSLGWVLFKKKNYAEAKKYLEEAIKYDEGKHVEIYDHLGDVYLALGEKDNALEIWKKGLTLENVTRRDDARKEAVKKKLAKEEEVKP